MRLRKALAAVAGGAGLLTGVNRGLAAVAGPLPRPLSGTRRTYRWRGFDVSYTEAGDPDDRDVVLLHGIHAAASSHEFDAVFDALAADAHVIAPDLPGFGHSDRPAIRYSASLYARFVRDFLADVATSPLVVGSSLTGAYAAEAAQDVAVDGLVLVCPTTGTARRRRPWLRRLLQTSLVGTAAVNLLVSKPSLRRFQADHGYYDAENYDAETLAYQWATAHQPGARHAPAAFVAGYCDPDVDLDGVLNSVDAPTTLVWGRDADLPPLSAGRALAEAADSRLVVFDEARLLPHVEHPDSFLDLVAERLTEA